MKKTIIGAIVGAIIIFIWQFLSFGVINFHRPGQQYTDKQDAIMSFLNTQNLPEGGYVMPTVPETATSAEMEAAMQASDDKPWAVIQYHHHAENTMADMMLNMIRGFLVNFVIVLLFIWLLRRMHHPQRGTIVLAALAVGFISFLNQPYTGFIWYKTFDIWAYFLDAVVSWGLAGLWLGWYLGRGKIETVAVRNHSEPEPVALG